MYFIFKLSELQRAYYRFKQQKNPEAKTLSILNKNSYDYLNRYALLSGLYSKLFPYNYVNQADHVVQVSCVHTRIPKETAQAFIFSSVTGEKGYVTLIEASPINIEFIKKYIDEQNINNINLIHSAVYNQHTTITFGHCLDIPGNSRILKNEQHFQRVVNRWGGKWCKYKIPANTLDDLIDSKVDFLNITINGFEYSALEGASRLMEQNPQMRITFPWKQYSKEKGLRVNKNAQIIKVVDLLTQREYNIVFADARQQTFVDTPFITGLALKKSSSELKGAGCIPIELDKLINCPEKYDHLW
ncbi:MAG: FkbM family methyltransferase [Candidatus Aminicenantes bacterium]|nr:FkbM family methyltransferase [Candidatus Aminicenantes bacterium]NIM77596.1 FkbM family methyltransferase [Candidatus Aminicenantes bacterium]NIN16910.1 FkbM family methyltransferase [Candidatus Aminicenantes bacterium]NIN40803.1 FkbM family methyltransferase [Candidatus Aminicenantes bacterium]NIN83607.1 FkbM family methyltransferase [Candidatus Aminicenantes bacterium]